MFKKLSSFFKEGSKKGPNSHFNRNRGNLFDFLDLIRKWEQIVGPNLAKNTIPLSHSNNILIILTHHPTISQTLSFLEEDIKKKIYEKLPPLKGGIYRIQYQINSSFFKKKMDDFKNHTKEVSSSLHHFDPKVVKLRKVGEEAFKDIKDEELKRLLISLLIQRGYFN